MKLRITLILITLLSLSLDTSAQWISLDTDMAGDGFDPALLDGVEYEYMHDTATDSLWLRMTAAGISDAQSMDIGINFMVWFPTPGADESLFNFWGLGNTIEWHRLLTVWVTGNAPSNYTGTAGISKGSDVVNSNFTGSTEGLTVIVDPLESTIVIGLNRADLIPDDQLNQEVDVAAAIGSSAMWNDDSVSTGTIPKMILSTEVSSTQDFTLENLNFYPNPAQSFINIESAVPANLSLLEFYDLSGRLIQKTRIDDNANVDISFLSDGVYLLKVFSDVGTYIGGSKLIKLP